MRRNDVSVLHNDLSERFIQQPSPSPPLPPLSARLYTKTGPTQSTVPMGIPKVPHKQCIPATEISLEPGRRCSFRTPYTPAARATGHPIHHERKSPPTTIFGDPSLETPVPGRSFMRRFLQPVHPNQRKDSLLYKRAPKSKMNQNEPNEPTITTFHSPISKATPRWRPSP